MIRAAASSRGTERLDVPPSVRFATTRSASGSGRRAARRGIARRARRRSRRRSRASPRPRAASASTAATGAKPSAPRRSRARPSRSRRRAARRAASSRQQLEAEPRRRVRAGAERAARVDHDRERGGRRRLPRRPDPERAHAHRPVELAPAVLPAGLDVGDRRAPGNAARTRSGGVAVRGELDAAGVSASSNPSGSELENRGPRLLGRSRRGPRP